MAELPQNWIERTLDKICTIITGKKDANAAVENGCYLFFTCAAEPLKINTFIVDGEAIILPGNGANVGMVSYYKGKLDAYQRTYVLYDCKISTKYLYYYLKCYWFIYNQDKQYGSATNYIRLGNLANFSVKIATDNEQKRIVKKLDSIMPKVDEINARLERIPTILKRTRQSILNQAITGELTKEWRKKCNIKEDWKNTTFKSITTKLTDGSHNPPPKKTEGYPVISAKNIKNNQIVFDNVERYTDEDGFLKENKRTNIKYDDIILGIIGASIGNLAIYKSNQKVIAQRSIAIIDTNINNEYVYYYMSSQTYQNCLIDKTKGAAQGGVYLNELSSIQIQIPPLEEQEEIVRQVKTLFEKLDKIEEGYKKAKQYTDKITQSVLHKAFTGNLVPQDPNDKPVEIPE